MSRWSRQVRFYAVISLALFAGIDDLLPCPQNCNVNCNGTVSLPTIVQTATWLFEPIETKSDSELDFGTNVTVNTASNGYDSTTSFSASCKAADDEAKIELKRGKPDCKFSLDSTDSPKITIEICRFRKFWHPFSGNYGTASGRG
jgi:hypothetical protein